jgi:solute carrier family 4 (sodium bicarbonate transporter), member 10
MLGDDADTEEQLERPIFSEMQEFHYQNSTHGEWKEAAR